MTATSNRTYYHKLQDYALPIHNSEFRSFGNRKKYFKSTTVTLQGNDVRVHLCLHCITVNTLVVEIQKGILLYSCHIVRKFLNIDTEHNTQQSQNAEARRR
jgi:hypothetical protein